MLSAGWLQVGLLGRRRGWEGSQWRSCVAAHQGERLCCGGGEEQREEITLKPGSNSDGSNHPGKHPAPETGMISLRDTAVFFL